MLILASGSPRRIALIRKITDRVTVIPSGAEENVPSGLTAEQVPVFLSRLKAGDVFSSHPDDTVLGCDTVVIAGGEILGKPKDETDARRMLKLLSGNVHQVVTGVTVLAPDFEESYSVTTEVEFYPLSEEEIGAYVATDEPYDKAGAYAIQGAASVFVKEYRGSYDNVVGFPTEEIRETLKKVL